MGVNLIQYRIAVGLFYNGLNISSGVKSKLSDSSTPEKCVFARLFLLIYLVACPVFASILVYMNFNCEMSAELVSRAELVQYDTYSLHQAGSG